MATNPAALANPLGHDTLRCVSLRVCCWKDWVQSCCLADNCCGRAPSLYCNIQRANGMQCTGCCQSGLCHSENIKTPTRQRRRRQCHQACEHGSHDSCDATPWYPGGNGCPNRHPSRREALQSCAQGAIDTAELFRHCSQPLLPGCQMHFRYPWVLGVMGQVLGQAA